MTPQDSTERAAVGAWADRYLDMLSLSREAPRLSALAQLTRRHLLRVPFENASALLHFDAANGSRICLPDPEQRLQQWERYMAGGVCFDTAMMVERLLCCIGYDAWRITGNMAPRGGVASAPFSHQAVVIRLDGRNYLVDVGNGAPFFEPLPTDAITEVHFGALAYRFRPGEVSDVLLQERWMDGAWVPFCAYDLPPATPERLDAGLQFHFTPGQSWVLGNLFLVRCTENAVYAVARNGQLTTYFRDGNKRTEPIDGPEGYELVARAILQIPGLPMREALAVQDRLAAS